MREYTVTQIKAVIRGRGCTCLLAPRKRYPGNVNFTWLCGCGNKFTESITNVLDGVRCENCEDVDMLLDCCEPSLKNIVKQRELTNDQTPLIQQSHTNIENWSELDESLVMILRSMASMYKN